jgi:MOSC domain-containing protein YiiM
MATVEAIFVASKHGEAMQALDAVQVKTGKGIVGDRYQGPSPREPGINITLIEAEAIALAATELDMDISPCAPRRNIVTRGIRLNDLVGRDFRIGSIHLRGIELCDPCSKLGKNLATPENPAHKVVRAFVQRGGLRAAVLSNGILRREAEILLDPVAPE